MSETARSDLGVAPEYAVMVGDNPVTDGDAVAAGIMVILLPPATVGGRRGLDVLLRLLG